MDIPSINAALSSIKAATDIAKLIKDSATTLEKAEVKLKMAELIGALADTKIQIADIKQLLLDRDEAIAALESAARLRANLTYEQPYYWQVEGESKDGPYCQKCYDADNKLIRLQGSQATRGWWQCHSCNATFYDKHYKFSGPDDYSGPWGDRGY
mgnify:CR=1 FL=1